MNILYINDILYDAVKINFKHVTNNIIIELSKTLENDENLMKIISETRYELLTKIIKIFQNEIS